MTALISEPEQKPLTQAPPGLAPHAAPSGELPHLQTESLWARHGQLACAIVAGVFLIAAKIIAWTILAAAAPGPAATTVNLLTAIAFILGFYFGGKATLESLAQRKLDINLLMILGAVLALFVGSAAEGALLLFLFTLSGALEHYAMQRTQAALESLMKLFPKEAIVLAPDGTQRSVPLEQLQIGDHVLVKPGAHVAADGEVLEGKSAIDESAITGEFMPREKAAGMPVYAGTLNKDGRLVIRVARPAKDTTLAKIIHLVSQASEEKAPVERLFDRVGSAYTACVLAASSAACLAMGFLFHIPWLSIKDAHGTVVESGAFYRAITLLIVASPCALIISTPVVILSAIATCARRGIVLKGGRHLESLAALKALVFDKTGTLTTGQVRLAGIDVIERNAGVPAGRAAGVPPACDAAGPADIRARLLQAAMSLESNSTHPLAAAVVRAGQAAALEPLAVTDFHQEPGQGIRGIIAELPCLIGSPALVAGLCQVRTFERITAAVNTAETAGETAVVLFYAGHAAVLRFSDTIRTDARQVMTQLRQMHIHPLVMLTGDSRRVANAVGKSLGLDEIRAELLPEHKLAAVVELVRAHHVVGMIGDGINDAPALARATVGIAMGTIGSDAAMQAADVVLLSDAIDRVPWLIATARRARRVMIQNLTFALTVIAVLVICSLTGLVGLPLGVIGHEGSTLLVVFNGLRLLLPARA